jgi:proton-translocating NAD(P)+ transhydrogenase subunit alpha
MNPNQLADEAARLANQAHALAEHAATLASGALTISPAQVAHATGIPFIFLFAIFVMAVFVGYYVIWNVTPALHSPLLAVTNAISSVIVVGAMLATGLALSAWSVGFGTAAVTLAAVNIFGGFLITHRMLSMFRRKQQ